MEILRDSAPVVEQISIDEAFLDVSDDPRPGEVVARSLRERHRPDVPAADLVGRRRRTSWWPRSPRRSASPAGLVVVPPGAGSRLPGAAAGGHAVGRGSPHAGAAAGARSPDHRRSGGAARRPDCGRLWGRMAPNLQHGRGAKTIGRWREVGKPGRCRARRHSPRTWPTVRSPPPNAPRELSDEVGARLREAGLAGTTVRLKLRWPDFTTLTRQVRLASADRSRRRDLRRRPRAASRTCGRPGRKVRLIGVGVSHLGDRMRQLGLFDACLAARRTLAGGDRCHPLPLRTRRRAARDTTRERRWA